MSRSAGEIAVGGVGALIVVLFVLVLGRRGNRLGGSLRFQDNRGISTAFTILDFITYGVLLVGNLLLLAGLNDDLQGWYYERVVRQGCLQIVILWFLQQQPIQTNANDKECPFGWPNVVFEVSFGAVTWVFLWTMGNTVMFDEDRGDLLDAFTVALQLFDVVVILISIGYNVSRHGCGSCSNLESFETMELQAVVDDTSGQAVESLQRERMTRPKVSNLQHLLVNASLVLALVVLGVDLGDRLAHDLAVGDAETNSWLHTIALVAFAVQCAATHSLSKRWNKETQTPGAGNKFNLFNGLALWYEDWKCCGEGRADLDWDPNDGLDASKALTSRQDPPSLVVSAAVVGLVRKHDVLKDLVAAAGQQAYRVAEQREVGQKPRLYQFRRRRKPRGGRFAEERKAAPEDGDEEEEEKIDFDQYEETVFRVWDATCERYRYMTDDKIELLLQSDVLVFLHTQDAKSVTMMRYVQEQVRRRAPNQLDRPLLLVRLPEADEQGEHLEFDKKELSGWADDWEELRYDGEPQEAAAQLLTKIEQMAEKKMQGEKGVLLSEVRRYFDKKRRSHFAASRLRMMSARNMVTERMWGSTLGRFLSVAVLGLFLPFVLVVQTSWFMLYTDEWKFKRSGLQLEKAFKVRLNSSDRYVLDILYPIFPRKVVPDTILSSMQRLAISESDRLDVDHLSRQTTATRLGRFLLTNFVLTFFTAMFYNTEFHFSNENELDGAGAYGPVSRMETAGAFVFFIVTWFLFCCWFAHKVEVFPDSARVYELHDKTCNALQRIPVRFRDCLHPGTEGVKPRYPLVTSNMNTFMAQWRLNYYKEPVNIPLIIGKFTLAACASVFFALIPAIMRAFDDEAFWGDNFWVVFRGVGVNGMVLLLAQVFFDRAFFQQFKLYHKIMKDLTRLVEVEELPQLDRGREDDATDGFPLDRRILRKRALNGEQFLALDDPDNLVGWLEMRYYFIMRGRLKFADIELFILGFMFVLLGQAGFIVRNLFGNEEGELAGKTVYGVFFVMLVNLFWLFRVFTLGISFDNIQRRQEIALQNQMECLIAESIETIDYHGPVAWQQLQVGRWVEMNWLQQLAGQVVSVVKAETEEDPLPTEEDGDVAGALDASGRFKKRTQTYAEVRRVAATPELMAPAAMMPEDSALSSFDQKNEASLRTDYDDHMRLFRAAVGEVATNHVNPTFFEWNLSSTLLYAVVGIIVTAVFGVVQILLE